MVKRQTNRSNTLLMESLEQRLVLSTTITVPGDAKPWNWSPSLNSNYEFGNETGTSPVIVSSASGVPFAVGESLDVTYLSGTASANFGGYRDAAGFPNNGYLGASKGSTGTVFPSFFVNPADYPAYVECLIGAFTDSSGVIVGSPFNIGDQRNLTVPAGATQLQLGANDDQYDDNSGSWQISVNVAGTPSSVGVRPLPPAIAIGSTVDLVAEVSGSDGSGAPTGTVGFAANGISLGTATVSADGVASLSTSDLPLGNVDVTLSYTGDTTYSLSTSQIQVLISEAETIGQLDPTFGTKGLASHGVGFSSTQGVSQDGTQSVIIGTIGRSPNEAFGITRYNSDGSLDTSFGDNGVVKTLFTGTDDVPTAVVVVSAGKILVAGTATTYAHGAVSGSEFAAIEYNADGSLDTSFGSGTGEVLVNFSTTAGTLSNDELQAMVVSDAGTIYLGGSSNANGKGNTDFAIEALNADGSVDNGFGTQGQSLLDFSGGDDIAHSLALQSNGNLVVAGSAVVSGVTEIALARFLPTGSLDKHFGTAGLVTTNVRGVYDSASSVIIQPKGQIVVGGSSATGTGSSLTTDFVLARYTSTGRTDRSFSGGVVTTSFGQPSAITQLLLETNGDIIASGKTTASLTNLIPSELDLAVCRFTTQGKLDTTFNTTGKTIVDLNLGVIATPDSQIASLATMDLGTSFEGFLASKQGPASMTPGGDILDAGNRDANTVEAELIDAGVDLVASVLSTLPSSVLGGLKGTASVSIKESGTTQAIGSVTIAIQFAIDAEDDGAVTAKSIFERISLKQGQSHSFKISFIYPSGLPNAGYYLVATLTEAVSVTDLNPDNNFAPSNAAVIIAPPTIALAGSSLSTTTPLIAGKSVSVMFDLTNNGNVIAKGKTSIVLFLSPDQVPDDGMQVISETLSIVLSAGKSHVYTARFILPSTVTAGSFYVLAVIDPSNSLGSTDETNSIVVDPTAVSVS